METHRSNNTTEGNITKDTTPLQPTEGNITKDTTPLQPTEGNITKDTTPLQPTEALGEVGLLVYEDLGRYNLAVGPETLG